MTYPTTEQYTDALQHPKNTVLDPLLATGTVESSGLGIPNVRCGGFALTFKITAQGKNYAFRCFQSERPGLNQRYGAVSRALNKAAMNEIIEFQWLAAGLRVQTKTFPAVRMSWVDGETLGTFVERSRNTPTVLEGLRGKLLACAEGLSRNGIAHGDIQSGNIIVLPNGDIRLVDYDAFFVPEIQGLGAIEVGHPNFQHPKRAHDKPFDSNLDAFSFYVLDTALRCLIEDPGLWDKSGSDPEGIVFRASDFRNPHDSETFHLASKLSRNGQQVLRLAGACEGPLQALPPTMDLLRDASGLKPLALKARAQQSTHGAGAKGSPATGAQYVPTALLLDASDLASCFSSVGKYVEVVGKVQSVRSSKTKYGQPFTHLVVGPATGRAFQVAIWSEGLAALKKSGRGVPQYSTGKWISITGIMKPSYSTKTWTRVSVDLLDASQIVLLTSDQAKHRLASAGQGSAKVTGGSLGVAAPKGSSGASRNRQLAASMTGSTSSRPVKKSTSGRNRRSGSSTSRRYSGSRSSSYQPSPTRRSSSMSGSSCTPWLIAGVVLLVLIFLFNSC